MRTNRSMPRCTVIPELGYPSIGDAIDRLSAAFGFTLRLRIAVHRAQLNVGDGAIVLTKQSAGSARHSTMVRVEDVDRHHQRAARNGARVLNPPADYPYGERQYTALDLAGHCWTFSESIADVDPAQWGGMPG